MALQGMTKEVVKEWLQNMRDNRGKKEHNNLFDQGIAFVGATQTSLRMLAEGYEKALQMAGVPSKGMPNIELVSIYSGGFVRLLVNGTPRDIPAKARKVITDSAERMAVYMKEIPEPENHWLTADEQVLWLKSIIQRTYAELYPNTFGADFGSCEAFER